MFKTRLVIEIDEKLRRIVKRRALDKNMTLKDWVLGAIVLAIQEEDKLEKVDE